MTTTSYTTKFHKWSLKRKNVCKSTPTLGGKKIIFGGSFTRVYQIMKRKNNSDEIKQL